MTTSQIHRKYVEDMAKKCPLSSIVHCEMMAQAESVNDEKIEWIKLALKIEKENV